ncbi:MAG TPA: hypothetical protein VIL23_05035 [Clostridia bacterium]
MRNVELKDDYFRTAPKFRRSFDQRDDEYFTPNRDFSYFNARVDGDSYNMTDDYIKESVTRPRSFLPREESDLEREKRIAAHITLYADRYNQARKMEEEQENSKERRKISLRDLDDRPQRLRLDSEDGSKADQSFDSSRAFKETDDSRTALKDRDFYYPQYDYYREYESGPYTYNRNRIDNEAYQSTFITPSAPSYRPASNVYGYAATIAERYKKQFADKEIDLKPSAKTMQYAEKKPDEKVKSFQLVKKDKTAVAQDAKKGLITLYVTIVVVIAVLIATTAMMISSLSQDISALENEINKAQNYIALNSAELSKYNDDNYIYAKAKEQGMGENKNVYVLELIPVKYQPEPKGDSNWFDYLCDFLSGVFGSSS